MHPILFHIGAIPIYSFGLMVTIGFAAGIALAYRLAKASGLPAEGILDAAAWLLISAIAGARLLFVLLNWSQFSGHWLEAFKTWRGGMSFHGGLVGALLAGGIFAWRRRLPFWALADAVAPGLALGYAIGRIGCFLNGCCYGGPTHLPWGVVFQDADHGGLTPPSHPVQLYATLINLGICALLVRLYRRKRFTGQVLVSYLVLYSLYRFGVEFLRKGVTAQVMVLGLTQAQVASLGVILLGCVALAWLSRRHVRTVAPGAGGSGGARELEPGLAG
jgi:phosphatidylglycerol:prolipoprotein diacylglycerol transferase